MWWMNCPQVRPIANLFRPPPHEPPLEEFDLDEAEKVEDNNDNDEAIEEGNVVAEPQQPAEAPETPAPEDEAGSNV